ncbi:hypothetical protein [Streptomyces beigongshangae]|uniref:hypothetical protein n=1 Tax=Streptomyces beigongshangae TaxID=2841597 RepID=UPI001C859619|nr:hypothetical protein [Streptomyces sp. REN17]
MANKDKTRDATGEKERERWMARFQVRLATQPGVDRAVVLQAVKDVTAHCAETREDPETAFGDPDDYAVQTAARLVPTDRAEHARRHNVVVEAFDSVLRRARDVPGL